MLSKLLPGNWSASDVSQRWISNSRRMVPEVEKAIDVAWATALARPGVHLFDGPMCRLESLYATDRQLELVLSKSSYKSFLGTNMSHPEFAEQFGRDVMANPVGVSPALVTADGQLLLGRRNASVAYYPNRVHPFAGCMEPKDASLFATVFRELQEELSLTPGELSDIRCIGIAEDSALRQQEMIFSATTLRTRAEIESRLDQTEHHSLWAISATAKLIADAVNDDGKLTPVAVATLLLWGRLQFGETWFADLAAKPHFVIRPVFAKRQA